MSQVQMVVFIVRGQFTEGYVCACVCYEVVGVSLFHY